MWLRNAQGGSQGGDLGWSDAGYWRAMSGEDVAVVRALFEAFADRDHDAGAGCVHEDVEIRPALVGGPEGNVYRGRDGQRQFWEDIDAAWAEFRIEPDEFRDLDGQVLVLGRAFARGRGSDISLDQAAAWLAEMHDGQVLRFRSFTTQDQALEAAGLPG
jgi:ketosteroid isomerase-like protein